MNTREIREKGAVIGNEEVENGMVFVIKVGYCKGKAL